MKTCIKTILFRLALMAGPALLLTSRLAGQTFTTLHDFTNEIDGAFPGYGGLTVSGSTLYGVTPGGGGLGEGEVFKGNTDGTGFTSVYNFTGNNDGAGPVAAVILSGGTLYGMTPGGGKYIAGTVFKVNIDGTGFTALHEFTDVNDGGVPQGGLVLSGNTLYGATFEGGSTGDGTVFAINTDGTGFTTLYTFTAETLSGSMVVNSDGASPQTSPILSGNTLYGTATAGGTFGNGTIFKLNTDGTGFTTLYNFSKLSNNRNSDGATPYAGLVLSGSTLYGAAYAGGSSGNGTLFRINTDGTGFTALHNFTAATGSSAKTNSDGIQPFDSLILSGNTLYGTASAAGRTGNGTVFSVNTDGTEFTNLYSFTSDGNLAGANNDGANPKTPLLLSGNTLYGLTTFGGSAGDGTVFSLTLPQSQAPTLAINLAGGSVIVSWPDTASYTLQQNSDLTIPSGWAITSYPITTANGTNSITVTAAPTGNLFFRLRQ